MAFRNKLFLVTGFVWVATSLGVAAGAVAQSAESLWRVESEVDIEVIPTYQKEKNPFPEREAPPVEVLSAPMTGEDPGVVQAMLREQERSRQAAYLLEKLRKIIVNESLLVPKVRDIKVVGRMKGRKGQQVLINNEWVGEGEKLVVPATGAEEAFNLLKQITAIDENLAEIVEDDLKERLNANRLVELKISKITDEKVVVKESNGKEYVISVPLAH